jgi:Uma2 family endonuclease
MTALVTPPVVFKPLPDHTQLPETDGSIVENFQEHPQGTLLTDCIKAVLQQRHPDGQYAIGHDSGIYWRITDPPLRGCKSPDWYYVPGVPPMLEGQFRRSYVLWQEIIAPLIIIEIVSGDGSEERDRTPWTGKFWVYEQGIKAWYYAIFEGDPGRVEVCRLTSDGYELVPPNERGHYPIPPLGVELGIWQGVYDNCEVPWLRWWDAQGNLLPNSEERIHALQQQTQAAEQKAERLAAQLRALGVNPEGI